MGLKTKVRGVLVIPQFWPWLKPAVAAEAKLISNTLWGGKWFDRMQDDSWKRQTKGVRELTRLQYQTSI